MRYRLYDTAGTTQTHAKGCYIDPSLTERTWPQEAEKDEPKTSI